MNTSKVAILQPGGLPRRMRGFPSRWEQEAQSWLKTNGFPGMLAA